MEEVLNSGYLEMGTQFPKKKMEAFLVILMSLCVLWCFVQNARVNDSGSQESSTGVNAALEEHPEYPENGTIMEMNESWLQNHLGLTLCRPIREFELKVGASQSETKVLTADVSDHSPVKTQEITAAKEVTADKMEPEEITSGNSTSKAEPKEAMPAVLTYYFFGNGGVPEKTELTYDAGNVSEEGWPVPQRDGKVFDGWYEDPACTIPYSGVADEREITELYAGWKDFDNFICDDRGYITSCTCEGAVADGILVLPVDPACKGITGAAFEGMKDRITDIYIPDNILYIEEDAFSGLANLMYIEVDTNNPNYYSVNGVLYSKDGSRIACPCWYMDVE